MALLPFLFLFLPCFSPLTKADLNSSRSIGHLLRTYALESFPAGGITGKLYAAVLPANLSGIEADVIRFRSSSLSRRGAQVKEFKFPIGLVIRPNIRRLIIIRQNLGNRSQSYYDYYPSRCQLATPVVGFLVYGASDLNSSNLGELDVAATGDATTIDFTNSTRSEVDGNALCAFFDLNGTVTMAKQSAKNVCKSYRQGHFGLLLPSPNPSAEKKWGRWKVWVLAIAGGVLSLISLSILLTLILGERKKKRVAKMERRAMEEEAFGTATFRRVQMPVAVVTRTSPAIENDYIPGN